MISYPKEALFKLEILEKAKKWEENTIISGEQYKLIKEKYNHYLFVPNIFVRIGLFILTVILANAALGMFFMFNVFFSTSESVIGGFLIIFGFITWVALQGAISIKKTYKAGIDDSLLYLSTCNLITGLCLIIDPSSHEFLIYSVIAFPFLVAGSIFYLDKVMAFFAFIALIMIIFLFLFQFEATKAFTPFLIMFSSIGIYLPTRKFIHNENLYFWKKNILTIQFLSLLTIYLSVNYFIVRELGVEMMDLTLKPNEDIPFSILFHITTLVIPIVYIFIGGKNKDKFLFWAGLVCLVVSVLTFKYYYSFAPIGYTLTFGGALVSLICWACVKYFTPIRFGISSQQDAKSRSREDLESLIISYSFAMNDTQANEHIRFGEGEFGGSGSGGSF